LLTPPILTDICLKVSGQEHYTVDFVEEINIGRQAIIEFENSITYISFSEDRIGGRNSSFQSFPTALVNYHKETNPNKRIAFYFLPSTGRYETKYFNFMYRLMKTAGTEFLNENVYLKTPISAFSSIEDIIVHKNLIRDTNKSNNSTYITRDENSVLQIFGKTYGASKYETTLLCLASIRITKANIVLYEIQEGGLKQLPKSARDVIEATNRITIVSSDLSFERKEFEENDSLRSPTYIYSLLEKLGNKKCALCDCEIPQIIQGAHIWPVASIKKANEINQEQKLKSATDGDNGLWLCNNHHKLFDINWLLINEDGRIKYKSNIREIDEKYVNNVTNNYQIKKEVLTPIFLQYLGKRNSLIDEQVYSFVA
jgi:hypothetical protein